MALTYKGIVTDDKEIVDLAGYDPREPDLVNKIWDDPNKMFVGFLSGKQVGYGMYATALAKASLSLGSTGKVLKIQHLLKLHSQYGTIILLLFGVISKALFLICHIFIQKLVKKFQYILMNMLGLWLG